MNSTPTVVNDSNSRHAPPALPPPLLGRDQISQLIQQGHAPATLPARLLQLHSDLQTVTRKFFKLSHEVKHNLLPASHGTELGYYHVADEKEYVTFRHAGQAQGLDQLRNEAQDAELMRHVERTQERLERIAQQLWLHTASFLHRVLVDVSRFIGLEPAVWEPILDGCLSMPPSMDEATPTLLRTFLYEPDRGVAASHKDNGLLTLCVGDEKGLQVWRDDPDGLEVNEGTIISSGNAKARRGAWEDASTATILVGTSLFLLSDGRVNAGSHRVVANPKGRSSVVFALRPSIRHTVDLTPFGGEGPVEMAMLWRKIVRGRVNVNAHKDVREEQQKERDARRAKDGEQGGAAG